MQFWGHCVDVKYEPVLLVLTSLLELRNTAARVSVHAIHWLSLLLRHIRPLTLVTLDSCGKTDYTNVSHLEHVQVDTPPPPPPTPHPHPPRHDYNLCG